MHRCEPEPLHPTIVTLLEPYTWNPEPYTRNPEPYTRNPEPYTRNLEPKIQRPATAYKCTEVESKPYTLQSSP
jgi:hypothetical protein